MYVSWSSVSSVGFFLISFWLRLNQPMLKTDSESAWAQVSESVLSVGSFHRSDQWEASEVAKRRKWRPIKAKHWLYSSSWDGWGNIHSTDPPSHERRNPSQDHEESDADCPREVRPHRRLAGLKPVCMCMCICTCTDCISVCHVHTWQALLTTLTWVPREGRHGEHPCMYTVA